MIRLLISMLCALGLAFAPAGAGAAPAQGTEMSSCTMGSKMPAKPFDHLKIDCCTPACQVNSAAALLPQGNVVGDQLTGRSQMHASVTVKALQSFAPTGLDPPPRG